MKVLRTLHNCKVNCSILQSGLGTGDRKGIQRDRKQNNPPHNPPTLHFREKMPPAAFFRNLQSSSARHKKTTLRSTSIFPTGCLVFHMAFLKIIFKNTATILMPYLSFPAYQGFFPLLCSSNHSVLKSKTLKEVFATE